MGYDRESALGAGFAVVSFDYAHIVWTSETADNSYEFSTDTFVVWNNKIVAQSFAAKIKPKR